MSSRSIIRSDDLVPRPWKNGQGVTWEIAIDPPGSGLDDFRWRVSRARIEAEGPFSSFPGCERWITCVEGAGFALHFEGGVELAVPPFVPVRFAGDRPVLCRLAGGPCTDINVIARRDLVRVAVAVVAAPPDCRPERDRRGAIRMKSWLGLIHRERCGCVSNPGEKICAPG
jgi:environmental stress-induced protein Ves